MHSINCDLGESWEQFHSGEQLRLLEYLHLANVCCGAHAGDKNLSLATFEQIARFRTRLRAGAHPGYPDRENFGRLPRFGNPYTAKQVAELVATQVSFAVEAAATFGLKLYHVKPHGALYNEAASNGEVAEAIAQGVRRAAEDVFLVGLAGSVMLRVFKRQGFTVLREAFADRRYDAHGLLLPRGQAGALLEDSHEIAAQVETLRKRADTFCVHSDSPNAVARLAQLAHLLA